MYSSVEKQKIRDFLSDLSHKGIDTYTHEFSIDNQNYSTFFDCETQSYIVKKFVGNKHTSIVFYIRELVKEEKNVCCSAFKNALVNEPFTNYSFTEIIEIVKKQHHQQTAHLRTLQGENASDYKKKNFIAVAFSGIFAPTRAKKNLQAHSGFICLDLDKLPADKFDLIKKQIQSDEHTYLCFVSPSGNGLKVVFKIDMSKDLKNEQQTHEKYFAQIESYFLDRYHIQIDKACKNVDRLCFLPHDKDVFTNFSAITFPLIIEKKEEKPIESSQEFNHGSAFEWCLEQIQKSEKFEKSNRNNFVNKLAWSCNQKGIDKEICLYKCLDKFVESDFTEKEIKAIIDSVYRHTERFNERPFQEKKYIPKQNGKNAYSSFLTDNELEEEIRKRQSVKKPAPLDFFPSEIFPYLNELQTYLKCEGSYVLLSVIAATASAIGSQYRVRAGSLEQNLNIWACNVGISSGSKSLSLTQAYRPLFSLSKEFSNTFMSERSSYDSLPKEEKISALEPKRQVIFSENETFESLIITLAYNRKGLTKFEDELTSWLEAMGMYKNNNGVEKDFWIKSFTPAKDYDYQRASGKFVFIPKERFWLSVAGGTQPKLVHKFFHKNLLEQGFPNRILFALPEKVRLVFPDLEYTMQSRVYEPYENTILRLYRELEASCFPYVAEIDKAGIRLIDQWDKKTMQEFDSIDYDKESFWKEVFAGIAGKQRQYILKLSLIFKLMHNSATKKDLHEVKHIETDYVAMAIRAVEYFMESYLTVVKLFQEQEVIPRHVVEFASVYKTCNHNISKTAEHLDVTRKTVYDWLNKYRLAYPKLFEAKA